MKDFQLEALPIDNVREPDEPNPNVMTAWLFGQLVQAIRVRGFNQPITVRPDTERGGYIVVDGRHRLRAAREAGLKEIPALVRAFDSQHGVDTLGLNRLRGDTDLQVAAQLLGELQASGFADLTLSGFTAGEVESLLRESEDVLSTLGEGAGGEEPLNVLPVEHAQRFGLKLTFDSEQHRDLVRAIALQNGATVEAGLVGLCERLARSEGGHDGK